MLSRSAALGTLVLSAPFAAAQSSFQALPRAAMGPLGHRAAGEASAPNRDVDGLATPLLDSEERDLPEARLEGFLRADLGGDFETGGNSLETRRGGWLAQVIDADEDRTLSIELGLEGSFYQFSGAPPLGSITTDPFNDLYRTWVGATYAAEGELGELTPFLGGELTFGGEDEVGPVSGLSVGVTGGWRYRAAEDLTLAVGLAAVSRLEDEARLWPFLGFDWRISEALRFRMMGPDMELSTKLGSEWSAYLSAEYDLRQYRLNDNGPANGAAFRDEAIRLGGGLHWQPSEGLRLGLETGLSYWRELTLLPADGSASSESEIDASPYVALELSFGF